ncbi:hypothetical protein LXA43DRAFT_1093969 [Ganoderma leucocontextum]|nr:hypothetical protein LXA43DRAFT_1093969 [Ganoderma leucocontextum]
MAPVMSSSPLPTVNPIPPIDNTFGAVLIGTFIGLTVFETFHIVLSTHACYYYLVTNYANPDAARSSVWSLGLLSATTASFADATHVSALRLGSDLRGFHRALFFFAGRIFRLGGARYRILVVFACILMVAELAFFCAATAEAIIFKPFSEFQHHTWLISAGAGAAFVADGLLTGVLVNLLRTQRTGVKRMDQIVDSLILYGVNTGLLTGMVTLGSLLFSLISPNNLIYAGFAIVATKMYANSLLAAETTVFEMQGRVVASPQKIEIVENSQAFLTFELVGIAV